MPKLIHRLSLTDAPVAVDSAWIEGKIAEAGLSLRKLAKLMGSDPTTLHNLIKGKRRTRFDEAADLCRILHVPFIEMVARLGHDMRGITASEGVRVRSVVSADLDLRPVGPAAVSVAPEPPEGSGWQAARVEGHASPLAPLDGAVIYYRARSALPPIGEFAGRVCVVRTNGLPAALRLVRETKAAGKFDLCDLDGSVVEAARVVSSVAPIEWVKV